MAKGTHTTHPGAATERTTKQVGELWSKLGFPLAPCPGIWLLPPGIPFEVSIERDFPPAENHTFPLRFPAQSPLAMVRAPTHHTHSQQGAPQAGVHWEVSAECSPG